MIDAVSTHRTQAEIRARFDQIRADQADFFGFRQEALFEAMEYDTVKDLLKPEVTPADIATPDVAKTAREYLVFAIGKAMNHRGISASRSIEKLTEWMWCLGEDELARRFDEAEYAQYGAPKLQLLVEAWDVKHDDADDEGWKRMIQGEPCQPDCFEGCAT